jgi:hypothetical protein
MVVVVKVSRARRRLHALSLRSAPVALWAVMGSSVPIGVAACGSRTGLSTPADEAEELPSRDLVPDAADAADTGETGDAADAADGSDAGDATVDATAPIPDAALPPIDVTPPTDAPNNCPDAAATLVYLLTQNRALLSFQPPGTFRTIGAINCPLSSPKLPDGSANVPNSMAVDRAGVAYVGFADGELFRVSTVTAACRATPFGRGDFNARYGMGFAADTVGGGETLYIAETENPSDAGGAHRLASVDTTTFALHVIGPFRPSISDAELTGTGAGDLFAFYAVGTDGMGNSTNSAIGQIDKVTAQVTAQSVLGFPQGGGWAFAFWGGDFYTFTGPPVAIPSGPLFSSVRRFRPSTGAITMVATFAGDVVVGAGVSTCAPQR